MNSLSCDICIGWSFIGPFRALQGPDVYTQVAVLCGMQKRAAILADSSSCYLLHLPYGEVD